MKLKSTYRYRHRHSGSKIREERLQYHRIKANPVITTASRAYKHLYEYHHLDREHFIAITLDGASRVINTHIISIGTLNQSLVHPREIFYKAIQDKAAAIIIAHNHPSGQLSPSRADTQVTTRLKEAGKLIGINIVDHIILTPDGYYSFQDEGLI
ncbi:MAG TPA: DNA repair protein RadC [Sulfurovum sp.]|nr:DNA repair protein RadC [Sulfurovum sp.]